MFRAKFKVSEKRLMEGTYVQIHLKAVMADGVPENERFNEWTPNGDMMMGISNPVVSDQIFPGQEYYVDFTLVPKPQPKV